MNTGPGRPLNFSFSNRSRSDSLEDLGRTILSVITLIPGGVVVFFPSYDYAELALKSLESSKILDRILVRGGTELFMA